MHAGHIHFATISSVPGGGGHLHVVLQSSDIGFGSVVGWVQSNSNDDDAADIVTNAKQMPMIAIITLNDFILIISLKLNFKN